MADAPELKPCPFCGGTDIWPEMGHPAPYGLYCRACKSAGPNGATDDPEPAIDAWNTRPAPTLAEALALPEIAALVEALQFIQSEYSIKWQAGRKARAALALIWEGGE